MCYWPQHSASLLLCCPTKPFSISFFFFSLFDLKQPDLYLIFYQKLRILLQWDALFWVGSIYSLISVHMCSLFSCGTKKDEMVKKSVSQQPPFFARYSNKMKVPIRAFPPHPHFLAFKYLILTICSLYPTPLNEMIPSFLFFLPCHHDFSFSSPDLPYSSFDIALSLFTIPQVH